MYVRIARFEGGTTGDIRADGERIRRDIQAYRRGDAGGDDLPPKLTEIVDRVEMLVDSERGSVAVCVYCATKEKLREADSILKEMSATSDGWGERVSVDTYEVVFDEVTKQITKAA